MFCNKKYILISSIILLIILLCNKYNNIANIINKAKDTVTPILFQDLNKIEVTFNNSRQKTVNVKQFGAIGDGVADDTIAIQNAIDYVGKNGGGIVYIPKGLYKIKPQISGSNAIQLQYNNIELKGESKNLTKLFFCTLNDKSPSNDWEVINGQVWRGSGIFIKGGTENNFRKNIIISNLELDGNAIVTTNSSWPANPSTGDGWDITHKGINFEADGYFDNIKILNCNIHNFRGELIYGGSMNSGLFEAKNNILHDTNSLGYSVTSINMVSNNEFYNCGVEAIECNIKKKSIFEFNNIHDCLSNGISIQNYGMGGEPYEDTIIRNNLFNKVSGVAIMLMGSKNVYCYNNKMIDCGTNNITRPVLWITKDIAHPNEEVKNINIYNNSFIAQNYTVHTGLGVTDMHLGKDIKVYDNQFYATKEATDKGLKFDTPVHWDNFNDTNIFSNILFKNNICNNTYHSSSDFKSSSNILLDTTNEKVVSSWSYPIRDLRSFKINVSFSVINQPTKLKIQAYCYDNNNSEHKILLLNNDIEQTIGIHTLPATIVQSKSYPVDDYKILKVSAEASNTNNIHISINIEELY